MEKKTKIILDADVIIHFIKGDCFVQLFDIFPEYKYIILNVVYEELSRDDKTKHLIDQTLHFLKTPFTIIDFAPKGQSKLEYAILRQSFGKGESACMVYCRDNKDVLGSSNLKDIKDYCQKNYITYLTTLDFLYYAFIREKMTSTEVQSFINQVIEKGSKLPQIAIETYMPNCIL